MSCAIGGGGRKRAGRKCRFILIRTRDRCKPERHDEFCRAIPCRVHLPPRAPRGLRRRVPRFPGGRGRDGAEFRPGAPRPPQAYVRSPRQRAAHAELALELFPFCRAPYKRIRRLEFAPLHHQRQDPPRRAPRREDVAAGEARAESEFWYEDFAEQPWVRGCWKRWPRAHSGCPTMNAIGSSARKPDTQPNARAGSGYARAGEGAGTGAGASGGRTGTGAGALAMRCL